MNRNVQTLWLLSSAVLLAGAGAAVMQLTQFSATAKLSGVVFGIATGLGVAGMLRRLMPEDCDAAPPALRKRYTREVIIAMLAYAVLLVVSILLLKQVESAPLRALIALLPVPPIAFVLRAMIRYIRDVDELQQRIELEAVSFATAFVSVVYLTGGFLQSAKVIDVPSNVAMIWVFPLVCLAYGLAKAVVARRYN